MDATIWVPALLIVVGIAGIVIPVIPGLVIALLAVLLYALDIGTSLAWWVFGICAVIYVAGVALQYAVPGKRLRRAGVGTGMLLLAVALGVIGFFVIPVVGGPIGFVGGMFLVEFLRSRDRVVAWRSTRSALHAVFMSMGIELLAGLGIATTWVAGVLLAR